MHRVATIIAFLLVVIVGTMGIPALPRRITTVGPFFLDTNAWGLSLYQDKKYSQYQFNAYRTSTVDGTTVWMTDPTTVIPSIRFNRDDVVIGASGTVYTEPTDTLIGMIQRMTHTSFTKPATENRIMSMPEQAFVIINPRTTGMLTITVPETTYMTINRDTKTIAFRTAPTTLRIGVSTDIQTAWEQTKNL